MTDYDEDKLITKKVLEDAKDDGVITALETRELLNRFDYTSDVSRSLLVKEIERFGGKPGVVEDKRSLRELERKYPDLAPWMSQTYLSYFIENQTKKLAELNEPAIKQTEDRQRRERLAAPPPPPPIRFPMSANRRRNLIFAAIVGSSTLFSLIARLFLF